MAKATPASTRAPRGSKVVAQAFFSALGDVPAAQQVVVAKAAQIMVRDALKVRRDKAKAAAMAAKEKSRQPPAAPRRPKAAVTAPRTTSVGKTGVIKKRGPGRPRAAPKSKPEAEPQPEPQPEPEADLDPEPAI